MVWLGLSKDGYLKQNQVCLCPRYAVLGIFLNTDGFYEHSNCRSLMVFDKPLFGL